MRIELVLHVNGAGLATGGGYTIENDDGDPVTIVAKGFGQPMGQYQAAVMLLELVDGDVYYQGELFTTT